MEGMEADGELSVVWAVVMRNFVTELRQSTTVPKTSVRRAFGGLLMDMVKCSALYLNVSESKMMGELSIETQVRVTGSTYIVDVVSLPWEESPELGRPRIFDDCNNGCYRQRIDT